MPERIEDLERRVADLERTVAQLQGRPVPPPDDDPDRVRPWMYLVPTLRGWIENPHAGAEAWRKVREQMGVTGEPIPAEELQRRMLEAGVDPSKNEFSRDIIAQRGE